MTRSADHGAGGDRQPPAGERRIPDDRSGLDCLQVHVLADVDTFWPPDIHAAAAEGVDSRPVAGSVELHGISQFPTSPRHRFSMRSRDLRRTGAGWMRRTHAFRRNPVRCGCGMQVRIGKEYFRHTKPAMRIEKENEIARCEAAVERLRENHERLGLHLEQGGRAPRNPGSIPGSRDCESFSFSSGCEVSCGFALRSTWGATTQRMGGRGRRAITRVWMMWGLSTGRPTSEHRGIPLVNGNAAKHRPGSEHLQAPRCCRPQGKHGCPTLGTGSSSGCPGGSAAGGRASAVSRSRRCTEQRRRTRDLRRRAGRSKRAAASADSRQGRTGIERNPGGPPTGRTQSPVSVSGGPSRFGKSSRAINSAGRPLPAGAQWCASAAPLSAPRIAG